MKRFAIAISAALSLSACEPAVQPAYQDALVTHVCTVEQHSRVEHEAEWCKKNTGFFSSYCYGSSIMRNCTKRQEAESK